MNYVDIIVVAIITLSGMLAFARGFVREALGLGSWVAAGVIAVWAFPHVHERFRTWIRAPDFADLAAFGSVFLLSLIVLSVLAGMISGAIRLTMLGGIDRTLGLAFGLVRGVGVIVAAYILVGLLVAIDRWPEDVKHARTLPFAYRGAVMAIGLLPLNHQPNLQIPPPYAEPQAADLLQPTPQGRAVARP